MREKITAFRELTANWGTLRRQAVSEQGSKGRDRGKPGALREKT